MNHSSDTERKRPILTTDAVVFSLDDAGKLNLLLIERKWGLFAGMMALPGGWVDYPETAEQSVKRELEEETSVRLEQFYQLKTFTDPQRDREKYAVSVAFLALTRAALHQVKGGEDAKDARWLPVDALPPLAFDHDAIVAAAMGRLRHFAYLGVAGCGLLPEIFSLEQLCVLHQFLSRAPLKAATFATRFIEDGILQQASNGKYAFNEALCHRLREGGIA